MKLPQIELPEVTLPRFGPLPQKNLLPQKELLPEQVLEGIEWSPLDLRVFKLIFKVNKRGK